MDFDQPPVVRVEAADHPDLPPRRWPRTIPAVEQLLAEGLTLDKGVTFLVGENGSGKSTIVEAVAMAFGMSPEGGSTQGHHSTRASESSLSKALRLQRGLGSPRWGFFLRAETMHGWYTYSEEHDGPSFHELSHGESFLEMLRTRRFEGEGFFVMDEPEAGLSFSAQLALVGTLAQLAGQRGTQVLVATHSPILTSLPGARILELDEDGFHERTWEQLDVVDHYRRFLDAPGRYLRHLLPADDA